MIIRKPYAFLIKNFRKIHIVLLILSLFVAYKLINVNSFVYEFMKLGTYDSYNNPITKHITILLQVAIIFLFVGSGALILLLRYKKKPWKIYLVPFIEYLALFFVLNMIKSFFNGYTSSVETTDLRLSRDLLTIFIIVQLASIGIFIMRVFQLDIKKFNFNSDEEFLELSEKDREEIEIRLDVDSNSIKRTYRKLFRNIGYVYAEHKIICNFIISILFVVIVFSIYKFIFITNKIYKEGQNYNANGYTMKINKAYFTDKDSSGNIITKDKDFIIVDVTITNNIERRKLNLDNFHLKNGTSDFITTAQTYADEFSDLGKCIDTNEELRRGQTIDTIIIFKVDKINKNKNYVLYYQENENNNKLRKIKLNIDDVSKLKKAKHFNLGDTLKLKSYNVDEDLSFDSYEILNTTNYYIRSCSTTLCDRIEKEYTAPPGNNILEIDFGSDDFEVKDVIKLLEEHGKIIYNDSDDIEQEINITDAIKQNYYGKKLYLLIPNSITDDTKFKFKIIYRNNQYFYNFIS